MLTAGVGIKDNAGSDAATLGDGITNDGSIDDHLVGESMVAHPLKQALGSMLLEVR